MLRSLFSFGNTESACSESRPHTDHHYFSRYGQPERYNLIYKNGDDLRQDQLCIQILLLFDKLWKAENLDLKLTPYRTIATSTDIGMVEMVHPSEPIATILKEHGGIQKYLQKHNRDESAPFMISKDAMDT